MVHKTRSVKPCASMRCTFWMMCRSSHYHPISHKASVRTRVMADRTFPFRRPRLMSLSRTDLCGGFFLHPYKSGSNWPLLYNICLSVKRDNTKSNSINCRCISAISPCITTSTCSRWVSLAVCMWVFRAAERGLIKRGACRDQRGVFVHSGVFMLGSCTDSTSKSSPPSKRYLYLWIMCRSVGL